MPTHEYVVPRSMPMIGPVTAQKGETREGGEGGGTWRRGAAGENAAPTPTRERKSHAGARAVARASARRVRLRAQTPARAREDAARRAHAKRGGVPRLWARTNGGKQGAARGTTHRRRHPSCCGRPQRPAQPRLHGLARRGARGGGGRREARSAPCQPPHHVARMSEGQNNETGARERAARAEGGKGTWLLTHQRPKGWRHAWQRARGRDVCANTSMLL